MTAPAAAAQHFTLWTDPTRHPGWLNMAIDSALLERAQSGERWLRLYAWEPCLSFGRHEPAARRYDADRIAALGLAVVRRPTGGRAVWHGRELTYAVAAPCDDFGSLREACEEIHLVLRDALRSLGAAAELAPPRAAAPVDAGACFAAPAGGEVLVRGRKVVGSAQLRQGAGLLQHGSVLLEDDQAMVGAVSVGAPPADGSAPLSRALGRTIDWEEAARSVAEAAERRWAIAPDVAAPAPILERALALADRFRSAEWTWAGCARPRTFPPILIMSGTGGGHPGAVAPSQASEPSEPSSRAAALEGGLRDRGPAHPAGRTRPGEVPRCARDDGVALG